jgi:hypothetical protein
MCMQLEQRQAGRRVVSGMQGPGGNLCRTKQIEIIFFTTKHVKRSGVFSECLSNIHSRLAKKLNIYRLRFASLFHSLVGARSAR